MTNVDCFNNSRQLESERRDTTIMNKEPNDENAKSPNNNRLAVQRRTRIPLGDHNSRIEASSTSAQELHDEDVYESFNYNEEIGRLRTILTTVLSREDLCQVISK